MRVGLLGPFEVRNGDDAPVEVPGARLRALLAALALEPGRIVGRSRLVDWIWGDRPPADEVNALQALVSRLRRVLPDGVIEAESGGYRLAVPSDAVDVHRFEKLVGQARAAEPAERADLLRSALELWRGPALADIALQDSEAFDTAAERLNELHVAALGDRVDADIRLGRGSELLSELTGLVAAYPLREGFVAALMRALAEAGRGNEALTVYQRTRERLAEELGADPSAELTALHTALLRGELGERAENRRTNLRAELTSFVGEDEDVAAVAALAVRHRLVTLTGPGGAGKTRLAAETARRMLAELPDGAWLVELASVRSGAELAQAALSALGLRDQGVLGGARAGDPMDRLIAAVRERALLLILDNCEHLIEEVAAFADRLLGECRRLRVLATSREPLGITGEVLWQVEPLALPAPGAGPAETAASPAVRLLRDRAELVRKDIGTDPHTIAAMARICRALDGIPLAIELAAARLRAMSVDQLARRLDDRFRLLTSGSRTVLPRHKTLRAVVDWSWDLLSEPERAVLRRLSVFAGGASLEAAERVCADDPYSGDPAVAGELVFDVLTALIEKSLVLSDGEDPPRFRMLGTIREYAAQRLAEAGETEAARRAHLAYCIELAETADPHLRRAEQLEWLAVLEAEHDNFSAALRGAISEGWAEEAMRLVGAAGYSWYLGRHRAEGMELSVAAASLPGEVPDEVRALAYLIVTMFVTAGVGGDQYQAQEWIQEAHRLAGRSGSRHPLLGFAGLLAATLGDSPDFLSSFEPLIAHEDPWVRAQSRLARARLRLSLRGDETDVDTDAETALAEFRALGERMGVSMALALLADRLAMRGEFARACEYLDESAVALTEVGATEDVVGTRARQAQLHWLLGDERAAESALAEARRCAGGIVWPDALAELALAEARLACWRGEPERAREHLARARTVLSDQMRADSIRAPIMDLYGYLAEDLEEARAYRSEAYRAVTGYPHPPSIAVVLVGLADLALRQGQAEQAVRLLAAGDAVRGTPDLSLPDAARIAAETRSRLGESAFAEAAREGRERDWRELAEITLAC
ncbi:BTAD domain-containing putative transcriptional regulator [Bailinhaonella thermotolerans]|uniref:Helix-turn-helix domain-containing protein n=1 Tax=Bailinhaonella thermotolerans TaxID=1070861 RepID=A0A3A4BKU9_9ACTN|nr:BTAD domain-containing putative transcriptional regulator [Bailinhaonella thermotolerans]RJL35984.1 helix-turn-helix domain-containing protein [Bailinhaonella thermotolerans]